MSARRQPFTPQRSPSRPGSDASPTLSEHAAAAETTNEGNVHADRQSATVVDGGGDGSVRSLSSWHALRGWTAHQSHGQATILFYVPRWTSSDSLNVEIGPDYVVAGVRGEAPIVKARLAGRIDPHSSAWQLEKRSSKRHRSRSRSRIRPRTSSLGNASSSSSGASGNVDSIALHESVHAPAPAHVRAHETVDTETALARKMQLQSRSRTLTGGSNSGGAAQDPRHGSSQPSGSTSPVRSDSSSFDLLGRSTDTLGSAFYCVPTSQHADRADTGIIPAGTRTRSAPHAQSPALSSPPSLSQSMTLSDDTGEFVQSAGSGGVRSLESSVSLERSNASSGEGSRLRAEAEEDDPIRDAKLVTLHLDKIDGGIWPCIVSGPVPQGGEEERQRRASTHFISPTRSQVSLNAALHEALRQFPHQSDDISLHSERSSQDDHLRDNDQRSGVDEERINESTVTVDTISSDDSTTVLGYSTMPGQQDVEHLYNMDPISLTLLGLQRARRATQSPFGSGNAREETQAFECLRRAWREAEIPAATECLVHDYFPLHSSNSTILAPYRKRLTAALGGASALARLYVSYAHLHMTSYDHRKPLLSLPMSGVSNNPFRTHTSGQEQLHRSTSPRLNSAHAILAADTADAVSAGPLQYLHEARTLDASVPIADTDWQEAEEIEEEIRQASTASSATKAWSGAASPTSRSEGMVYSSDGTSHHGGIGGNPRRTGERRRRRRNASHNNAGGKRRSGAKHDKLGGPSSSAADPGIVFLVVSRAALLSVMVAGGMAVAGWWRRAAASGGGS